MKINKALIHTPPGSKPLYMEEAKLRGLIRNKLTGFFENWSFLPVETPTIDYFDAYSKFLSDKQKKGSMRFVNRDGDIVILRNDITLFAAKSLIARASESAGTMRYYYADSIVRCQDNDAPTEYYQIGCEIVGEDFTLEELETLTILFESVKFMGLSGTVLHIGDISFYQKLFNGVVAADKVSAILDLIRLRDLKNLNILLKELKLPAETVADCLSTASFIGNKGDFKKLKLSDNGERALSDFRKLVAALETLGYGDEIVIDFSELPELDYYNGIIFHLYAEGIEMPLVSGGRYDLLFNEFGLNRNAVGFSFWLYPLEKLLMGKLNLGEDKSELVKITESDLSGLKRGAELAHSGKKVEISY